MNKPNSVLPIEITFSFRVNTHSVDKQLPWCIKPFAVLCNRIWSNMKNRRSILSYILGKNCQEILHVISVLNSYSEESRQGEQCQVCFSGGRRKFQACRNLQVRGSMLASYEEMKLMRREDRKPRALHQLGSDFRKSITGGLFTMFLTPVQFGKKNSQYNEPLLYKKT